MEDKDKIIADLRAALRAYGQRDAVAEAQLTALQARFDALRERATAVAPHIAEEVYTRCNYVIAERGKPAPRTCMECGLGPCKAWRPFAGVASDRLPSRAELEASQPQQEAVPAEPQIDLHNAIMNPPVKAGRAMYAHGAMEQAYKEGHRDARHAAAELVTINTEKETS